MVALTEYRACMSEGLLRIKPETKLERKKLFCSLAKVCSGKAKTIEEGLEICLEKHPKWR